MKHEHPFRQARFAAANQSPLGTREHGPSVSAVSPFADWDDDTIRAWITEQGGDNPHHKCSHDTLVAKADELNAALAAQKAA